MPEVEAPQTKSRIKRPPVPTVRSQPEIQAQPVSEYSGPEYAASELEQGHFTRAAFLCHASMIGDPRMSHPANARARAEYVGRLQRSCFEDSSKLVRRKRGLLLRLSSGHREDPPSVGSVSSPTWARALRSMFRSILHTPFSLRSPWRRRRRSAFA